MIPSNQNLIFLDLETTGLNPDKDVILEIAALPVSPDLEILDEGWSTVIHYPMVSELPPMDAVVSEMHTNNGLLAEIASGGLGLLAAQNAFLRYANQFAPYGETPLAGSSIHFDRRFLQNYMPAVDKFFHYRIADVSSMKEFWKRWFPDAGEPPKVKAHRALDDCRESVAEAKWYMVSLEAATLRNLRRRALKAEPDPPESLIRRIESLSPTIAGDPTAFVEGGPN